MTKKKETKEAKKNGKRVTRLTVAIDLFMRPSIEQIEAKKLFKAADDAYVKATGKESNIAYAEAWTREAMAVLRHIGMAKLEKGSYIKIQK